MGLTPDSEQAYGYFNPREITAVIQTHDDSLGSSPINTEATIIEVKASDTYYIPLHIEAVMELLSF